MTFVYDIWMGTMVLYIAALLSASTFASEFNKTGCNFAVLSDSLEGRWQPGPGVASLRKVALDEYDLGDLTAEQLNSFTSLTITVSSKRPPKVRKADGKKPAWTDDTAFRVTEMKRPDEPHRYAVRWMQPRDASNEQLALRALAFMKEGTPPGRPLRISFYLGNDSVKKSGTPEELEIWLKDFLRGRSEGLMFISSDGPVPLDAVEVKLSFDASRFDETGKLSDADEEPKGSVEKQLDIKFPQSSWNARLANATKSFIADTTDSTRFDNKSVGSAAEQVLEKLTSRKLPSEGK